jgi:hypothetical protein
MVSKGFSMDGVPSVPEALSIATTLEETTSATSLATSPHTKSHAPTSDILKPKLAFSETIVTSFASEENKMDIKATTSTDEPQSAQEYYSPLSYMETQTQTLGQKPMEVEVQTAEPNTIETSSQTITNQESLPLVKPTDHAIQTGKYHLIPPPPPPGGLSSLLNQERQKYD